MTFVIPDHRTTKAITLTRPYKGKSVSLTVRTNGKRTIDLGPSVAAQYAECLHDMVERGELVPVAT